MGRRLSRAWSGLLSGLRWIARKTPGALCDFTGFIGAASISYGARLIYEPAGFLVAGMLLIAFALLIGRRLDARQT